MTDVGKIRQQFLHCYQKTFGRSYPGWGVKENSQAKNWLRSCSIERALALCEFYCLWKDRQASTRGHPFSDLVVRWVELSAWCEDARGQAFRIAEARISEKLSLKEAEDVMYVSRLAERNNGSTQQAANTLKVGGGNRPEISDKT